MILNSFTKTNTDNAQPEINAVDLKIWPCLPLHFTAHSVPVDIFTPKNSFDSLLQCHYSGSLAQLIKMSMKENNLLGSGAGANVYRIPNMPHYVLRVKHSLVKEGFNPSSPGQRRKWDIAPVNLGQPVYSFYNNKMQILSFQRGSTTRLSISDLFQRYGTKKLFDINEQVSLPNTELLERRKFYKEHLKQVADMTQEAYDGFARKLKVLENYPDLHFDPNIRNVLLDKERQEFNLVDLGDNEGLGPFKTVAGMAIALTDSLFVNLDHVAKMASGKPDPNNTAASKDLIGLRRTILTKVFLAGYRTGLKPSEVDWPEIPKKRQATNGTRRKFMDVNYVCELSGFNWQKVKTLLNTKGLSGKEFLVKLSSIQDSWQQ